MKTSFNGAARRVTNRTSLPSASKVAEVTGWEHQNPLIEKGALAKFNSFSSDNELKVWPNRSISSTAIKYLLSAFALLCVMVSGFSFVQGNVLAPAFMGLDFVIVACALIAVARRCQACDALTLKGDGNVLVRTLRGTKEQSRTFQLCWIKVNLEGSAGQTRIWLSASGQSVEFGSFLNMEQRASLGEQVRTFLDLAKSRALSTL